MYTMKDTFYYIAGRFCPTGMGYTYYEYDVSIIEVKVSNRKEAEEEVKKFCYNHYGVREKKDMWYGIVAYNWNYKEVCKGEFDRYKTKVNDPNCKNYTYVEIPSLKLYEAPKVTISYYKNPSDYNVSETQEIKEFFS